MKLNVDPNNHDIHICGCGNDDTKKGFYACLPSGEKVEQEDLGLINYTLTACARCGRLYDPDTSDMVGSLYGNRLSKEERFAIAATVTMPYTYKDVPSVFVRLLQDRVLWFLINNFAIARSTLRLIAWNC